MIHSSKFDALYAKKKIRAAAAPPKFKVDDRVRILKKKKTFEKGFTPNWTEEVYTISEVKPTIPVTYTIKDTRDEEVKGTFYEPELQKTEQEIYWIEKILRRRKKRDGVKEVFVKWRGYTTISISGYPRQTWKNEHQRRLHVESE